jgi:adenylate kinase
MRLVLLGAPGCGKGTQGPLLVDRYGIMPISTGDILRAEIREGSALGIKADEFVSRGALVPDNVILDMMEKRMNEPDMVNGFLLDGFPRTLIQAEGLDRILDQKGLSLDAVIKLEVSEETILRRLTARRICPACTQVYNLESAPPKVDGKCDRCGGEIIQREDDKEATVAMRLKVYEGTTAHLVDYYEYEGLAVVVDGEGAVDEVAARIEKALGDRTPGAAK